jgi:hypothetical protein
MESGRRHHAIERAVFSYAVSAGSLCDTTALPKLPLFGGLIIADPDAGIPASDLAGARTEAASIRSAFYPDARLVGRNPDGSGASDGPGTRHYVEGWLANAEAGTMLHAACHGIIETRTDDGDTSFLQLAAGDRLTAENLLRGLVGGKRLGLALAVLSACSSNVPGRGYDEALSLASTFLAAGTRTVISSQWRVPDSATSVLMFFFHHYLHNGHSPARALRAAQLWMIDPDRVIPDIVPSSLRHHLLHSDPARIEAWAGFIHFGQ